MLRGIPTKAPGRALRRLAVPAAGLLAASLAFRPGANPYLGRALKSITGKGREDITLEDLLSLGRPQLVGVFHQLVAPEADEMNGEYRAALLNPGNPLNRALSGFFLYAVWGLWGHKAFEPLGGRSGRGYNTFRTTLVRDRDNLFLSLWSRAVHLIGRGPDRRRTARLMRNRTYVGPSMIDNRTSFHLVYRDYNSFPVSTMHDEVRKVNDRLFLGMGALSVTGGRRNLFPFVLVGPPEPWTGPDRGYPEGR